MVGALVLSACTPDRAPTDALLVGDELIAPVPATSPPSSSPAGTVLPLDGPARVLAMDTATRTLAVAMDAKEIRLFSVDSPQSPPRVVAVPDKVTALSPAGDGALFAAVPSANTVVRLDIRTGSTDKVRVEGGPSGATVVNGQTVVSLRERNAVVVLDGERVVREVTGFFAPTAVLPDRANNVLVLDINRTALLEVDVAAGKLGSGLRAGDGATNAVIDRFGRALVVDTRGGELLAFGTNPFLLKQRFPVPGTPYGIAYDTKRDLAWVTLTERNEVVGFDVAGGEPVEKFRFPTVRQPDSVAVDPDSGRVFVASADREGIQVVQP
ncbi:YncE family protein [Allokutzneria oryzae]|uniref:YncE family protein n=1 Tax=Allokutzneria oryzae TaxID=1378989 RepID=UPI00367026ED